MLLFLIAIGRVHVVAPGHGVVAAHGLAGELATIVVLIMVYEFINRS
jgi:hypothetical protein